MLTYTLEKKEKESLYEQLYRFIREDILSGRLQTGERLPSKRMLAQHLEVSIITVKNASGFCLRGHGPGLFSLYRLGQAHAPDHFGAG